ncbi:MAG: thioredoxin domain-containing protein [Gammaproteobacteria bacterium]|nr:thioredoxin domain-containing protein [Gammaproteobacteria bacterium]
MNRLSSESSPYLLQHADNPVDWYPWGDDALDLARREQRPILLSVGYSACHWCHVMAHESFENPKIAAVMNKHFVNIKVDREERPDLDKIYQTAHQLIARRPGGWPLTMFLHHDDQRPFFGGTYFPDTARHGMPGFPELLERIAEYYATRQDEIQATGDAVVAALAEIDTSDAPTGDALDDAPLRGARDALLQQFDADHGGFGGAPKFPHPGSLDRLLRHWRASAHSEEPDTQALYAVALSLTRMAEGGIYDQLGGGFCRYSVDQYWSIPHFEKMLYDNGPLLALYAQAWLVSGDELFRRVANETADWVIRDMHTPHEGLFSTLDADSEGEEGKFYVWTPDQVRKLLAGDEYPVLAAHFGLDGPPNFEGHWHLRITTSLADAAAANAINESAARRLLDTARSKLLAARDARIWPGRDEKILTSWNGLMIRGLAIASRAMQREDLSTIAAGSLDFIREKLVVEGQLLASYKDDRARFPAYLDDHAFLLDAVIELLQSRWDSTHLEFAAWLADQLLARFVDAERGGFYFTAEDHESLIHRSRSMADDAIPSGNAVAALALGRLGHLLGESRYLDAAEQTLRAAWTPMSEFPHGHPSMVTALEEFLQPPTIVILRGAEHDIREWRQNLDAVYAPRRLTFAIPADTVELPESLAIRTARDTTVAYVCEGPQCSAPITSLDELGALLSETRSNRESS